MSARGKAEVSALCEQCGQRPKAIVTYKGKRARIRLCRNCALAQKSSNGHSSTNGHSKRKCEAKTRTSGGRPCTRPAGWGTDHVGYGRCKFHGGCTPDHRKAAARQIAAEMVVAGMPVEIHPLDAILRAVSIAAGEVNYFTVLISSLTVDQAAVQHEKIRPLSLGKDGEDSREVVSEKTSQTDLHIWIRARQDALDRLVKYSKTALDAGIDERRVKMAEQAGGLIVKVLTHFCNAIELTAKQKARAPEIVRESIGIIEGVSTEERVAA